MAEGRRKKQKHDDKDEVTTTLHDTALYVKVLDTQWPIVYGPEYNIGFLGFEKLHPFDAGKWGKVYAFLKESGMIRDDTTVRPVEATEQDLMVVHPKSYINSLKWSMTVAGITEVPPVAILPNFIVQRKVLRPFRYQTGGTILAAKLAVERGWGINIGGGFHHCSSDRGGGFCAYADITLAIRFLFLSNPAVTKAMIVDLDAHQGNGHERDFMEDDSVYIMDVYNRGIYPHDGYAKRAIRKKVELVHMTKDQQYLDLVRKHLDDALNEFSPDVIVYNAGTDILDGDPLGCLSISAQGIIERDQIVFEKARSKNVPVVMVTSGGYQRTTARIIADSILNLKALNLIPCAEAENCPLPVVKEKKSSIPRSQSDVGLFARLKNICMSRSSTQEQMNKTSSPSKLTSSETDSRKFSQSTTELHKEVEELDQYYFKDTNSSKSCTDLRYSFKDESDIDISSLLDSRFGTIGRRSVNGNGSVCGGHRDLEGSSDDQENAGTNQGDGNVSFTEDTKVNDNATDMEANIALMDLDSDKTVITNDDDEKMVMKNDEDTELKINDDKDKISLMKKFDSMD